MSKKKVEGTGERKLEVYPPIYKAGPVGKWLRDQLMKGILRGSPVLLSMQRLRSRPLNLLMGGVSFMGEEEFYTLLVPPIVWVFEARLGRLLALLMTAAFYCTGFLKNSLCLPRPPVPPVVPLHKCNDWSLPSHHALLSVNIPWYIWFYMQLHYPASPSEPARTGLFLCISLWSFLVMFSRMYLGVHSPADILCGGVVGCLLLAVWLQVDLAVDQLLMDTGGGGLFLFLTVIIVMLYLHPDPSPETIIYDETTSMVGVAGGVAIGHTVGSVHLLTALLETMSPTWWHITCAILRCCVGLVLVLVTKQLVQVLTKHTLMYICALLSVPCVYHKKVSEVKFLKAHYSKDFITLNKLPDQPSQQPFLWSAERPLNIQTAVRLLTYSAMGLVMVLIAPKTFALLNI